MNASASNPAPVSATASSVPQSNGLLLPYADAVTAGPSVAGGKGWNLGRLARYGFDVPAGGVLVADAYRAHLAAAGLDAPLAALADVPADRAADPATATLLDEVRRGLEATPLPVSVTEAVRAFLAESGLDGVPLAVRSSATAEDGSGAPFAGMHESVLSIVGADAVLDATRQCYASLWTPRALGLYANRPGGWAGICSTIGMAHRGELTDQQWERLKPLLPPERPETGRPNVDHRRIINGILWRERTGSCGENGRERRGAICRSGMARGRRCTAGSGGGARPASGIGCSPPSNRRRTRPARWTGTSSSSMAA